MQASTRSPNKPMRQWRKSMRPQLAAERPVGMLGGWEYPQTRPQEAPRRAAAGRPVSRKRIAPPQTDIGVEYDTLRE